MTSDEIDLSNFNVQDRIEKLEDSANQMWIVIAGSQILLMQLGFAFLEGGCVRYKNLQSIMIKVFLNSSISVLMTWLIGYGLMYGDNDRNNFLGTNLFAADGFEDDTFNYSNFVLTTAVAMAANSIVSGGAAERMTFFGYMILSVFFSGWIYPIVIHWAYEGWLHQMGYHDFAGSGAIHLTGAIGALVTTYMLKPRHQRFNKDNALEFEPCNITYIVLSTLSLYFCWMFFNAGSSLAITGDKIYITGTAGMNTLISGASGGITVFIIHYILSEQQNSRFSLVMLCNGNLAGLVAVTGPCDNIEAWAALLVGIIGGIVYVLCQKLLHHYHVDDPVDAIPIHGGCGIVGALYVGFLDRDHGLIYGFGGRQLGIQVLGIVCFSAWSFVLHYIINLAIRYLGILRIDQETEQKGIDFSIGGGGPGFYYENQNQYHQVRKDDNQNQNDNQIELFNN